VTSEALNAVTTGLHETLEQLIEQFTLLETILGEERTALERRNCDQLLDATGRKHGCALQIGQLEAQLERALNGTPLRDMLNLLTPHERGEFEPLHTSLMRLATQCRHHNAVNGKVVHRSRQSVAELARILSGTDADSIYTAQGTQRQFGEGHAITHV
jgi:flagellar biosynthesis/type III secretory pathway chaperone